MKDFQLALGQYELYRDLLDASANPYPVYLAVEKDAYQRLTARATFRYIRQRHQMPMLIVDEKHEEVEQWIR
jgi:hypothetical protein